MILVTVGTQMPFDRLVGAMDRWAACHPEVKVVAQTGGGACHPASLEAFDFLAPDRLDRLQHEAELIVSHAGMGTILSVGMLGKPLVIMPRSFARGEHRNDHQAATARRFEDRPGIHVAWEEKDLHALLDRRHELAASSGLSPHASPELLAALGGFIAAG